MTMFDLIKKPLANEWRVQQGKQVTRAAASDLTIKASWAGEMTSAGDRERLIEWYFECILLGYDTLKEVVDINPKRRGGVPVLRGTRFTVSQTLAELANSSGVEEVAEQYHLDSQKVSDLLTGLSLIFMRPIEK